MTTAELARRAQVREALRDEMARFNKAIDNGALVMLNGYPIMAVTPDHEYYCPMANGGWGQHWMGWNNLQWASFLKQAGVERNDLWGKL